MNAARVAELLRALADELEGTGTPASAPPTVRAAPKPKRPRRRRVIPSVPSNVTDLDVARADRLLARQGMKRT